MAQSSMINDNIQIKISPNGDVVVFGAEKVRRRPATESGVVFEEADNGQLIVYTNGTVTAFSSDYITMPGQRMTDGTFYLGCFEDERGVKEHYFVAAEDEKSEKGERLLLDFRQSAKRARKSKAHGYKDWTVPGAEILNAICENKADISGLELSSSDPFRAYRSSEASAEYPGHVKVQRLTDGARFNEHKSRKLPLRLVRSITA